MQKPSNKAAFIKHPDVDVFIRNEKKKRPWMRHSVAFLVLPPRADSVALVLPKKAAERGATQVRVPPQCALLKNGTVKETAACIARDLLTERVKLDDLLYLGSGRGNSHLGGKANPYGKGVHWVGIRLNKRSSFANSDRYQLAHWCAGNHLLATVNSLAMSQRKYMLTLQALAAFAFATSAKGSLLTKVQKELAA